MSACFRPQLSTVERDDALAQDQAQAGSGWLGSKKGSEKLFDLLGRHSFSGIAHFDP